MASYYQEGQIQAHQMASKLMSPTSSQDTAYPQPGSPPLVQATDAYCGPTVCVWVGERWPYMSFLAVCPTRWVSYGWLRSQHAWPWERSWHAYPHLCTLTPVLVPSCPCRQNGGEWAGCQGRQVASQPGRQSAVINEVVET